MEARAYGPKKVGGRSAERLCSMRTKASDETTSLEFEE